MYKDKLEEYLKRDRLNLSQCESKPERDKMFNDESFINSNVNLMESSIAIETRNYKRFIDNCIDDIGTNKVSERFLI